MDPSPTPPSPRYITSKSVPLQETETLHIPRAKEIRKFGSVDFAHLDNLDENLIDTLLDEVDEDEKEAPVTAVLLKSSRSLPILMGNDNSYGNSFGHSSAGSQLDFTVEAIDGDMIDSILDEVQQKERRVGPIGGLESNEDKVKVLEEVASATDDAVNALTGFFVGIGHSVKDVLAAGDSLSG